MNKTLQLAKKLNLAFLGCGRVTRMHSKTLTAFRSQVNCWYASRERSRADAYQKRFGGEGAFGSYQQAIESKDIDVALIATPPQYHLEWALAALRAGKHVIVEKPPFLKASDFDLAQAEAEKNNRQLFIAENYFYKPLLTHLKHLIEQEVIGEILFVHFNALKGQEARGWRGDVALSGGGALFEGGVHWVNFISNLGLNLHSVRGLRPGSPDGLDRSMMLSLQYREGAVGSLYYSWETPSLFKGLRLSKIYGREGSLTFESNGLFILLRGKRKRIIFPGLQDISGFHAMFSDFLAGLQENRPAQFTLDLAKRDLEIIERAYKTTTDSF